MRFDTTKEADPEQDFTIFCKKLEKSSVKYVIEKKSKDCLLYTSDAGYPCGLLIAPVIIMEGWKEEYRTLLQTLRDHLSPKMKREMFLEVILMTYSFVHRAINGEAFPAAPELYDKELMTGRGRGKYCYRPEVRADAEQYLREEIKKALGDVEILYIA